MSTPLLSQVLESPWFFNEVAALIAQQILNMECTGYPSGAGTPGTVVDYELSGPLVFGPPEGEGLRFHVPFEGRGVASGECKTSDSEDYTYSRDAPIMGTATVELGVDTLVTANLEQIIEDTIIEITFTGLHIDDQNPTQGPAEKFAGES